MDRLTFEGDFCDISLCPHTPGGSHCEGGNCTQKQVWERLKEYEDVGLEPRQMHSVRVDYLATVWGVKGIIDAAARALEKLEDET